MRRWLAILMLVLLPLQSSWAAVASLCGNEALVSLDGPGDLDRHDHAAHDHGGRHAAGAQPGEADEAPTAATDVDCGQGHCHGHCVGLTGLVAVHLPPVLGSLPPGLGPTSGAEHLPAQPERPQWLPLA